jgi:hypothetical protein
MGVSIINWEIAAFFRFTGDRISEVKVYREGSADP